MTAEATYPRTLASPESSAKLSGRAALIVKLMVMLAVLGVAAWYLWQLAGQRQAMLLVLGVAMGAVLYCATFSFGNGWRRLITERNSLWIRAQMIMLVVASALILPVLAKGSLWGMPTFALVRPIGVSLVVGAFVFGIGMQIAGSCASGTLYHAGGGQLKMLVVLVTFAMGALWASAHYGWWMAQANFAPVTWTPHVGVFGAVLVNAGIAAGVYWLVSRLERARHGRVMPLTGSGTWGAGQGLLLGGLALAVLNFLTVGIAGRPWSVSNAFPLWGAKGSQWLGIDLEIDFWDYWANPVTERALAGSLLDDITSVMNIGIIIGAMAVALLVKRYQLNWRLPIREWLGAALGGTLLGYGATIAFGCNIGAFFGGVVSGSLHGWIWFLLAFAGTAVGVFLRPLFIESRA